MKKKNEAFQEHCKEQSQKIIPSSQITKFLGVYSSTERDRQLFAHKVAESKSTKKRRVGPSSYTTWGQKHEGAALDALRELGYNLFSAPTPSGEFSGTSDGLVYNVHGYSSCLIEVKCVVDPEEVWRSHPNHWPQVQANMYYADVPASLYMLYHPQQYCLYLVPFHEEYWKSIYCELKKMCERESISLSKKERWEKSLWVQELGHRVIKTKIHKWKREYHVQYCAPDQSPFQKKKGEREIWSKNKSVYFYKDKRHAYPSSENKPYFMRFKRRREIKREVPKKIDGRLDLSAFSYKRRLPIAQVSSL